MKKIYQIPEVKVVLIRTNQMICYSLPEGGKAVTHGIKSADARGARFSDEDWDEE